MKKQSVSAKRARESSLLEKLCTNHGYSMQDLPKGKRVTMVFEHNRKTKRSRVVPMRCIVLMVPDDSALGKQLAARYKQEK